MGQVSILVITEGWTLVPTLQGFPLLYIQFNKKTFLFREMRIKEELEEV